ncbi:hypothetical protein BDV97DRAFT_345947 [Delphinella strobiligena]|nr:hypothetical protein BDV97DRAFT_345947 [Delphinella strobiligena]
MHRADVLSARLCLAWLNAITTPWPMACMVDDNDQSNDKVQYTNQLAPQLAVTIFKYNSPKRLAYQDLDIARISSSTVS